MSQYSQLYFHQHTLKHAIEMKGVGVHTGKIIRLNLKPAPVGTGIIFRRIDLSVPVDIPAHFDYVVSTDLSTCIGHGQHRVATVEHLLAAAYGLGVSNMVVEIDSEEVPIMDGSAYPFIFAMLSAGTLKQNKYRSMLRITKPIIFESGAKSSKLEPYEGLRISFKIDFNHPVFASMPNFKSYDFSKISFIHDIARARTFGFTKDIAYLKSKGLALGGDLKNAIVLNEESIMNPGGLRSQDEFVSHKIIDAIGDLSLCGHLILGHFTGICSGHALNNHLMHHMFANKDCWEVISYEDLGVMPI